MKTGVVIVAAGNSTRMGKNINKMEYLLGNQPVIKKTVSVFNSIKSINEIVVVCRDRDVTSFREFFRNQKIVITSGGDTRQKSVYEGLKKLSYDNDYVLIHDGARPFIRSSHILECIDTLTEHVACALGVKTKDTIKVASKNDIIINTPDRNTLYNIQTPQCFHYNIALKMHEKADSEKLNVTDDCALAEILGYKVKIVKGSYDNIKITTTEDLSYANFILDNSKNTKTTDS